MNVNCKVKIKDELKIELNKFQKEINILSDYRKEPELAITIAKKYLSKTPDLEFIDGWGTPIGVLKECSLKKQNIQKKRGGKREGAGRKKQEPTVVIRVPKSLEEKVKNMIEEHKKKTA